MKANLTAAALLSGCGGPQSALAPAGSAADALAGLFWALTAGALAVWLAVSALILYALWPKRRVHSERAADRLIVSAGVVLPIVVLTGLLAWSLSLLPRLLSPPGEPDLRIHVSGEQWWWRVRYLDPPALELANEIHLPVGARVELLLDSPDVIHSFWVPSLAGKVDMIPGRQTRLLLDAQRPGVYRGVCAEYCGASHAFMAFFVIVHEAEGYERWLAAERREAQQPRDPRARRGAALFLETGCGACHTVRGTTATGVVGPDLTHVGSRRSVGAGRLDGDEAGFARWLEHPDALKPAVNMPPFGMLPPGDLRDLAAYLEALQ